MTSIPPPPGPSPSHSGWRDSHHRTHNSARLNHHRRLGAGDERAINLDTRRFDPYAPFPMSEKNRARKQLREHFIANVGRVMGTAELFRVAGIVQYARRIRELRDQEGMQILSHRDRRDLKPGEYLLETLELRPTTRGSNIPNDQRIRVLERDGYTCQACGAGAGEPHPANPTRKVVLQVDHIRPDTMGGPTNDANLRALCSICNEGRSNLSAPPDPQTINVLGIVRRQSRSVQEQVFVFLKRKFGSSETPSSTKGRA